MKFHLKISRPKKMQNSSTPEIWKPVVGYEGHYEVSSFGRVRTLKYQKTDPCLFLQGNTKTGYLQVQLWKHQKPRTMLVHHLVARAFLGPAPEGQQVRHVNGDRLDARLSNLEYGTAKQNSEDKIKHGTVLYGDKHPRTRIPDSDVGVIKARYKNGERMALLAKEYGVSVSSIKNYVSGLRKTI